MLRPIELEGMILEQQNRIRQMAIEQENALNIVIGNHTIIIH